MYRRRVEKKFLTAGNASTSSRSVVAHQTQQKSQHLTQNNEKENDEVIQSSQNDNELNYTQSRFKSQRAIMLHTTQQELKKGKGYLEVTLNNCGMEFTEIGKQWLFK